MTIITKGRRIVCAAAILVGLGSSGRAQEAIGVAAIVRNEVTKGAAGLATPLVAGDNVVRRETVSTGRDSTAKLVFLDQTNLAIGPQARIVLDELVYPGENARGRVVLDLTEGAFRFVSGKLPKESYQIRTATATIGIRGTGFSVLSQAGVTVVTLEDGAVVACARGAPGRCIGLRNPGETAVITSTTARRGGPSAGYSFAAAFCGADPALCSQTTLADSARGPSFAALCGR